MEMAFPGVLTDRRQRTRRREQISSLSDTFCVAYNGIIIFSSQISKESSFPCLPTCPTQHGTGVKRYYVIFPPCIGACVNFVNKTLCGSFIHQFSRRSFQSPHAVSKKELNDLNTETYFQFFETKTCEAETVFLVLVKLINPFFGNSLLIAKACYILNEVDLLRRVGDELKVQGLKSGLGFLSVSLSVLQKRSVNLVEKNYQSKACKY